MRRLCDKIPLVWHITERAVMGLDQIEYQSESVMHVRVHVVQTDHKCITLAASDRVNMIHVPTHLTHTHTHTHTLSFSLSSLSPSPSLPLSFSLCYLHDKEVRVVDVELD